MTPARNRVTPLGDVVAIPLRGAWTGNRGCLHEDREVVRFHASDLWIICRLRFKGRHSAQWQPKRFTWLYFHDEAVALAAGHRPCGECRRSEYVAYREAWAEAAGGPAPTAQEMNRRLHGERIHRGTHRRRLHEVRWRELPPGAFALVEDRPALVLADALVPWTVSGYGAPIARPGAGRAVAITPPASIAALRAGYAVQIDAEARDGVSRGRR
jgi:hypothetical protein